MKSLDLELEEKNWKNLPTLQVRVLGRLEKQDKAFTGKSFQTMTKETK